MYFGVDFDAIDFLMNTEDNSDIESSSDEDNQDLAMLPPLKKVNAETDMDGDTSDDINPPGMRHRSDISLRSHIGRDVADHAQTSS